MRWLDLARDADARALGAILDGLARENHVPEPLRRLVAADEAQTRWAALRQFAQRRGHYLVTSGAYQLEKWSDAAVVLQVFRDMTNPLGVGTYDRFAIPRRAYVARIPRATGSSLSGDRGGSKFLRQPARQGPLRSAADEDKVDVPACRFVIVGSDGRVAAAGISRDVQAHRVVVDLKGRLKPGAYTAWWLVWATIRGPRGRDRAVRFGSPELRHLIRSWMPRPSSSSPQRAPRVGDVLIAGRLSLICRVMRIVNLAHGNLYAFSHGDRVGGGARSAPPPGEPLDVRCCRWARWPPRCWAQCWSRRCCALYRQAEEYQLLITFRPLLILEDVMRLVWGPYPLRPARSAGARQPHHRRLDLPTYNLAVVVICCLAAAGLWAFVYRTHFGVVLRATSQNMRMASALGVNVNRVYVQAFTLGCFMAGLGGSVIVPQQGAVLGMGVDALILAFVVVVIGGLGSLEGALIGALMVGLVREAGITFFPEIELAVLYLMAAVVLLIRPAGILGRA